MISRLAIRLLLFILPFAILTAAACAIAIFAGEAMPLSWVHSLQRENPQIVYSPADEEFLAAYKFSGMLTRRPKVVAIGSSRIRYFTAAPFRDAGDFYNLYLPAMTYEELTAFVRSLTPETAPDVFIIGFDVQKLLLEYVPEEEPDIQREFSPSAFFIRVRRVLQDLLAGRQTLDGLIGQTPVGGATMLGLGAKRDHSGFRADGSSYDANGRTAADVEARVALTIDQFYRSNLDRQVRPAVIPETLAVMRENLLYLKALDVEVIGVVMPYTLPSLVEPMQNAPRHAPVFQARQTAAELFASLDLPLFDFFDSRESLRSDEEIADGRHPTEAATERLFMEVICQSPSLHALADPEHLKQSGCNGEDATLKTEQDS